MNEQGQWKTMERRKASKIIATALALSITSVGFSDTTQIGNNAKIFVINALNNSTTFVSTAWSMLANSYNLNPVFQPAGAFSLNTAFIPGVAFIRTSASGTLEVGFGPTAPGPLANNGFALAPTRVSLNGTVVYLYQLPQCYTNIMDELGPAQAPQPCSPSMLISASNLGTNNCVYMPDPYAAAIAEVQGTSTCSSTPGSGTGAP